MNLPLDHLALRVAYRDSALGFLGMLGYTKKTEFEITLEDGSTAQSFALVHPSSVDVFVSSGPVGSKIDRWVKARGGVGAVHHLAYACDDVEAAMVLWGRQGIKFQQEAPLVCSCSRPLTQVFTQPCPVTGLVYELISRNGHPGFCTDNVRRLMSGSPE